MHPPNRPHGLAELVRAYDVFLVDQFGTLHDGQRPYPGAIDALHRLRAAGKRVVLLSNSGKRAAPNAIRLERLGILADAYDESFTSGEVAWRMLRDGQVKLALGRRRCLLISRDADRSTIEGLDLTQVDSAEDADLVVIGGSEGEHVALDRYAEMLAPALRRGIPALCANPDRTMLTEQGMAFGAGRIAELYQELGGEVAWIGKPYPEVYRVALAAIGDPPPGRVLCIGDSVEHDVVGARRGGCAAALVMTGIAEGADAAELAARFGAIPDFVLARFAWDEAAAGA